VCSGPPEAELRAALEVLLEGSDVNHLSYSQLHKQLEEQFKVGGACKTRKTARQFRHCNTIDRRMGGATCFGLSHAVARLLECTATLATLLSGQQ